MSTNKQLNALISLLNSTEIRTYLVDKSQPGPARATAMLCCIFYEHHSKQRCVSIPQNHLMHFLQSKHIKTIQNSDKSEKNNTIPNDVINKNSDA